MYNIHQSYIKIYLLIIFTCLFNFINCIANTSIPKCSIILKPITDSTDIYFESYGTTKKLYYPRTQRLALFGKDMNANGAWSPLNMSYDSLKTGKWFIEQQRYAADAIVGGIVKNDSEVIERGLIALEWGMKQQQEDGSFSCPDNFHSTSFYIESVAHACLLLKTSPYFRKYEARITPLESCITKAVTWMLRPDILANGTKRNSPYTHRRYLVGAAIGETGVLCRNNFFIEESAKFISEGISLQDTAGFNPEKKGFDCSYHAVGLLFAHRYFDIVANEKQRKELLKMFENSFTWLLSRIDTVGNLNVEGNTRTGSNQEKTRDGKTKSPSYGSISNAILWWSFYKHDIQLESLAVKVFNTGKLKSNSQVIGK